MQELGLGDLDKILSGFCHYRIRPLKWLRILTIIQTYRLRVNSFTQKRTIKDYESVSSSLTKHGDTLFTSVKSLSDVILTTNTEQACIRQEG